ncbi:MAG: mechanosensitive ion channel family protein [Bacteroides sp.]
MIFLNFVELLFSGQVLGKTEAIADKLLTGKVAAPDAIDKLSQLTDQFINWGIAAGGRIIAAALIFIVGRFAVSMLNRLVGRLLDKRNVDVSIKTFVRSLVNILLTVLLIVAVVGQLGIDTTSFAALLASAGLAVGMALSGNLQNFAGGLIILLFKPFKVGDWVENQGVSGTVKEIQIFHTILTTADNKLIYIPNGSLSSSVITNYSHQQNRRVEWIIGVDYGEDYEKVERVIKSILDQDKRFLTDPEPFIALHALDASSVNVVVRAWVKTEDYWGVYFEINKQIYETFNKQGINFPFPQMTIHKGN